MWLSVAFPTCPNCHDNSHKCFHKNCPKGAKAPMEINPDTSFVRCPSCETDWHIKKSNYYCSCGYIFSADDVCEEIDAIVINARIIAKEMRRSASTWRRIDDITNTEIERKTEKIIQKNYGEKVWTIIKSFLPAIVEAVRKWLGI